MIVVGVDGSHQSRRALVWAVKHAVDTSSPVQAVSVVSTAGMDDVERAAQLSSAERMVSEMVEQAVRDLPLPMAVTYEVVEGDPTVVMLDASRRADLLVFGAHEMTSIRQTALGTVSAACIRMGACPVLVIPVAVPDPVVSGDLVPASASAPAA